MTDKEIRVLARERLAENTDVAVIAIVYFFGAITVIHLFECFITAVMNMFVDPYYSFLTNFGGNISRSDIFLLIVRFLIYFCFITSIETVLIRYFINMNGSSEADRFTTRNWSRIVIPCVQGAIKLLLYKILVSLPLFLSIQGIIHFRNKSITSQLKMTDLVFFMLCIGFLLVWIGELVHYYVSLSLVPYIFAINPRANFFDACDLSVKLMDGKHLRVAVFWLHFLPYMLPCVLVYPLLLFYPYMLEVKLLFAREIIGDYWQDKIPAMARRWERQQERLTRRSSV